MKKIYDAAIIGAGVIGAMAARELSRYELDVCLLEKGGDVSLGASKANSAIVHAGFDAHEGSLKARFNVRGSEMMEDVARALGVRYERNGSLVIAFTKEDDATVLELFERGKANGVRDLRVLTGDEARALEPNLSENVSSALYAPTGAIICPYGLTIAAVGNAMDNGVELERNFEVGSLEKTEDGWKISSAGKTVYARYVINCAGLYSDTIARMAGDDSFTVHPRRGEYLVMDRECGSLVHTTVFNTPSKMGKGILVTPTVDGNLLVGPTSEDDTDKENTATTPEGIEKIVTRASANVNGIDTRKTITSFTGLRAVGDTGDFIINNPLPHFINCAAIESPGLSSSPAIAEYVASLLEKDGLALKKKEHFIATRRSMHFFEELTEEEKNELIAREPAYGRTVCRCENVTEGEILDALRMNPRAVDIDGVKRRTRAGMGRCQGGFCMPTVAKLIASERGIEVTDVTKTGGSSKLTFRRTKGGDTK